MTTKYFGCSWVDKQYSSFASQTIFSFSSVLANYKGNKQADSRMKAIVFHEMLFRHAWSRNDLRGYFSNLYE